MLESAVGWLAGIALDLLLNFVVVWLIMDLIGLVMELFSRLFLIKSRGAFSESDLQYHPMEPGKTEASGNRRTCPENPSHPTARPAACTDRRR